MNHGLWPNKKFLLLDMLDVTTEGPALLMAFFFCLTVIGLMKGCSLVLTQASDPKNSNIQRVRRKSSFKKE